MNKLVFIANIIIVLFSANCYAASDFPQTSTERRTEEIGSLRPHMAHNGQTGIILHSSRLIRDRSGRVYSSRNEISDNYLWQATVDIVDFAPLVINDIQEQRLVTDWYSNLSDPNRSFKLSVKINDNTISPESLQIKIQQRHFKNGRWLEDHSESNLSQQLAEEILSRARQLYFRNSTKRR